MALIWLFISASNFLTSAHADSLTPLRVSPCRAPRPEANPCLSASSEIHNSSSPTTTTDSVIKRPPDKWFAEDKLEHFALSLTLTGSAYHLIRCRLNQSDPRATVYSLGFTFGCGLGKEIWDATRPKDYFSYKDLVFDILGIGAGYLLFIHQFR